MGGILLNLNVSSSPFRTSQLHIPLPIIIHINFSFSYGSPNNSHTMDRTNLAPDDYLLRQIFPDSTQVSFKVFTQDWTKCTCLIDLFNQKLKFVLRLSLPRDGSLRLRDVSAMSCIASLAIPELVPEVKRVGITQFKNGRSVQYSITEYIAESSTLDAVWYDLTAEQHSNIVDAVVDAMKRLQTITSTDTCVQEILIDAGVISDTAQPPVIGCLDHGLHTSINDFFSAFLISLNDRVVTSTLTSTPDGITVSSMNTSVHIPTTALLALTPHIVFCHGDLEPRNILIRSGKLVAIIDWEMAGFFPFGYEYVLKDTDLGWSNMWFGWYTLFKTRSLPLLPEGQEEFMGALDLAKEGLMNVMTMNVGVNVRRKWIAREGLVRCAEKWRGWERGKDWVDTGRGDDEVLEDEVLHELGITPWEGDS